MFCKYCGNELNEQSIVCTGCGCLASDSRAVTTLTPTVAPAVQPVETETQKQEKVRGNEKRAQLFSMLSFIFLCVEFFFLCIHIADALQYIFGMAVYRDTAPANIAFIFAWAALGMAITAFVFGVKIRRENRALRTITIFVFAASITMFIVPLAFMGI